MLNSALHEALADERRHAYDGALHTAPVRTDSELRRAGRALIGRAADFWAYPGLAVGEAFAARGRRVARRHASPSTLGRAPVGCLR